MDRKELKQAGKALFTGNYWRSVLVAFLMTFTLTSSSPNLNLSFDSLDSGKSALDALFGDGSIEHFAEEFISSSMFTGFAFGTLISIVATVLLNYFVFSSFKCGGMRYFLKLRKNQPVQISEIIANLKDKTNFNIAKVLFSRDISVFLWTLLFIIPGIIKAYQYAAIEYILAVRPDIDAKEAKRLSKVLMDGNKMRLFVLSLSFFGWTLLAIPTAGILNIFYVNPYMQATFVEFFSEIRLEALAKGTIYPNDIPDYEFNNPPAHPFFQQPENITYGPDGNPVGNTDYPQQPFTQTVIQPAEITQEAPVEQFTGFPVEPVEETPADATEETVEETIEKTIEGIVEKSSEEATVECDTEPDEEKPINE